MNTGLMFESAMTDSSSHSKSIFVAGHRGMVGSSLSRYLKSLEGVQLVTRGREQLDLTDQHAVHHFFENNVFDEVYLAAAKVGGIYANNEYPADFLYDNLMIQSNIIHAAFNVGVNKLIFLGSSCIYPREAEQPIVESSLLSGALEPTNEPYAIAKIAGIKLCESYNRQYDTDFRSVMPTNLYGENDSFHPQNSHVIPAMMRRFHEAKAAKDKEVVVWGSGNPRREFLHVDDMVAATVHVMNLSKEQYQSETDTRLSHLNVGTGIDCSIRELATLMSEVVGFDGDVVFDKTKPDGAPKKLLNVERMRRLGWQAGISLRDGLERTYQWYIANHAQPG